MIAIKHLYKSFGDHTLFSDFNLEIQDQDFVVIAGNSGSGKTTLLNMIGALEPVDRGSIEVNGLDITKKSSQKKYFSDVVGFLFQNFALIEDKTVLENLKIIRGRNRSQFSIEESLDRVGLSGKKDSKVYTLSGGEQQRIALARLMIKKCNLILADEPTGSLDSGNARAVLNILKELNNMGKTVLIVSHDKMVKTEGKRVVDL